MSTVAIDSDTGRVIRLSYLTRLQINALPYHAGESQYRCPDCGERVILKRQKSDPNFRDRFNHESSADCAAAAAIRGETAEHLLAKETLARWLAAAHPGCDPRIEPGTFGAGNERTFKPDVTAWTGTENMVGIEYQRSAMDVHEPGARVRAYFADVKDPGRLHLWIFSTTRSTRHFIPGPRISALDKTYQSVKPTRDQRDIVTGGGSVYFAAIAGRRTKLYVPVSASTINYEIRPGELWSPQHGRDPRRDWRAAQYPDLDPDADLWLIVPVDLYDCKISNNRRFLTSPAYSIARALINAEPGREAYRRGQARSAYQVAQDELARLRLELERAACGNGPAAVALLAEAAALSAAAGHEQQAARHRDKAGGLREQHRRLQTEHTDLTTQARRGARPALGRMLRGKRRGELLTLAEDRRVRRLELAGQIRAAELDAAQADRAASQAHPAGAARRARAEASALEADIGTRRAEAVRRDTDQVVARIAAAEAAIAAHGRYLEPGSTPTSTRR